MNASLNSFKAHHAEAGSAVPVPLVRGSGSGFAGSTGRERSDGRGWILPTRDAVTRGAVLAPVLKK